MMLEMCHYKVVIKTKASFGILLLIVMILTMIISMNIILTILMKTVMFIFVTKIASGIVFLFYLLMLIYCYDF